MNYTNNHWLVSSKYKDTVQESKTLNVPDLSYAKDYRKVQDEPSEAIISNATGSDITTMETIRYGASVVNNVYSGTDIDNSCMAPYKKGVQTLVEVKEIYTATHENTGDEIQLPCTGRIVLKFPTHTSVSSELVQDLLVRTVAAALNTGVADAQRQIELARGSLLPDGL